MATQTTAVKAFLNEEFDKLLEILEIRQAFESGEYLCTGCNEIVTHENVMMIFPLPEHTVGFLCPKPECRIAAASHGNHQNGS